MNETDINQLNFTIEKLIKNYQTSNQDRNEK